MINLESVKGYKELSQEQKTLLKRVYTAHMNCIESKTLREKYTPIKVASTEYGVRVEFKAALWLHYKYKGEWY